MGASVSMNVPWTCRYPWLSLVLGLAIGLFAMLFTKFMTRRHIGFYITFYSLPANARLRWSIQKTNLSILWAMLAAPIISITVAWALGIAPLPAFIVPYVWCFLLYPEYRRIYAKLKSETLQP